MGKKEVRCARCGRITEQWHYLDGMPVCADDRLCWPGRYMSRKLKQLERLQRRWAQTE